MQTVSRRDVLKTLALVTGGAAFPGSVFSEEPAGTAKRAPNVVLILSDDVGYGDVSCYGAKIVHTPNIDKLAADGIRFTDAHSCAATCTPSRYAILSGIYAWRKKGARILPGDAPLLLDPERPTIASQMKKAGYTTGCVGKWHVGLGDGNIDWNGVIKPGPLEVGFDYSFIVPATPDRVPCVYLENHRVANLDPEDPIVVSYAHNIGVGPTAKTHPEMLKMKTSHDDHQGSIVDGVSREGYMSGGLSARWVDETMAPVLTQKAVKFIEDSKDHPFFLYFAPTDIHVPHVPNTEFVNTTACGIRCDAIHQLDWTVGQITKTLDRLNLTGDTLVIFTSDNGPIVDDGYDDGSVEHLNGHRPAGKYRGGKYQIWEGGTRLPFIVSWAGHVKPGVSSALIGQTDLLASFSALTGTPLAVNTTDSVNVLPALLGESKTARTYLVEEAKMLALRKGNWKLIDPHQKPDAGKSTAATSDLQLYDLGTDPAETTDVAHAHPELVQQMTAKLLEIRAQITL